MDPFISVILCTHNPRQDYLDRVLAALHQQTLPVAEWELLVIDNASEQPLGSRLDLSWHPRGTVIREEKLGLSHARLCGFRAATAELLVFVDDDNVLDSDYLSQVVQVFRDYPNLGAMGGKSLPEFAIEPEPWLTQFQILLALRDFGEDVLMVSGRAGLPPISVYPAFAPCGAGMALRRGLFAEYVEQVAANPLRLAFGRSGQQLTSGEDNDIILTVLEAGWGVGYFPQLKLTHLIAAHRLTRSYLARLNYAASRSWVQVLGVHGIQPWKKISRQTVLLRQLKAFLQHQAWRNTAAYISWRGMCGTFAGQSVLL